MTQSMYLLMVQPQPHEPTMSSQRPNNLPLSSCWQPAQSSDRLARVLLLLLQTTSPVACGKSDVVQYVNGAINKLVKTFQRQHQLQQDAVTYLKEVRVSVHKHSRCIRPACA